MHAAVSALQAFPIPAPAGTPPWVGFVFLAGGAVVLVVLVMQAVRYFRDDARRDDARRDDARRDDPRPDDRRREDHDRDDDERSGR